MKRRHNRSQIVISLLLLLAASLSACGGAAGGSEATAAVTPAATGALATSAPTAAITEAGATAAPSPTAAVVVGTAEAATAVFSTVETAEAAATKLAATATAAGESTAIPSPPAAGPGPTTQRYRLLAEFSYHFFCDPDYYPVAVADELALALARFPEIEANGEAFAAILNHLGLGGQTSFSDEEKLLIYQEHKRLASVQLTPAGDLYTFQLQIKDENGQGFLVSGTIDAAGVIVVSSKEPTMATCPICLAADTLIDTPAGLVPVRELRPGDMVWTVNETGQRVAAPLLAVGSVPAPANHQVSHIVLDDGRELWLSPGHPTAAGRPVGALRPGDWLDGARVVVTERLIYGGAATYDLLPAGATGFYWANGVLLGSTLAR